MFTMNVSICGPEGYQACEGEVTAWPRGTDGSMKWLEIAPGRLARENVTAKTSNSLIEVVLPIFFPKGLQGDRP